MKIRKMRVGTIAIVLACSLSVNTVNAAEISSKGRYEAFDESTKSSIILDSKDFRVLQEEIDKINDNVGGIISNKALPNKVVITNTEGKLTTSDITIDELKNIKGSKSNIQDQLEDLALRITKFGSNVEILYNVIDGLDNNIDNKLSGTIITKDINSLSEAIKAQTRTSEKASVISENGKFLNIKIPLNGYYTLDSEVKVPLSKLGNVDSKKVLNGNTFSSENGLSINGSMNNYSNIILKIEDKEGKKYSIDNAEDNTLNTITNSENTLISSYGDSKMSITLPLDGYVNNPTVIIDNDVITKQNTTIKDNIIIEYMSDLDIHTIDGYATGTVRFTGGMDGQGWCNGQGSTSVVAWTNNLGKPVKFLPISGINESACTLEPGDVLHATITGSYHSLEYKFQIEQTNKTYYKFYLLY